MTPAAALITGLVAGLAVAVPLGAIGVLLVGEGLTRGFRGGLPGAFGVASVDAGYATAAVLVGAAARPVVAGLGPWPGLVGGGLLLLVAAAGVRRSLRRPAAVGDGDVDGAPGRGPAARFAVFVGLTAVNPATVLSFTALTTGLGDVGRAGAVSSAGATLFVVGVAAASAVWQVGLVGLGALFGVRAGPGARRATGLVGAAVVAALGVTLLVRTLLGTR